jgi:hypothetical protein
MPVEAQHGTSQPTRGRAPVVVGVSLLLNLIVGLVVYALLAAPPAGSVVVGGRTITEATSLFALGAAGYWRQQDAPENPTGTVFDTYPHPSTRGALAYTLGDRWDTTELSFYLHNCPRSLNCNTAHEAVRAGFESWQSNSSLVFQEVDDPRSADIELMWTTQSQELGRIGGVLAFAFFPRDGGDIFFDDSEPWTAFDGSEFDIYLTATHEIGHALGLDHSSDPYALMYPVLTGATQGLAEDDVAAIQALYGRPQDRPNQNFDPYADADADALVGQITDEYPYEIWDFEAFEGETLVITMTATSGDLEPYVGLLTGDEEIVLAEEGANGGDTAQITYTFDETGDYVLVATRQGVEEGRSEGSYELTIEVAEQGVEEADGQNDGFGGFVDDATILVTFRAYTPFDLCGFYLVPAGSSDWGENLLPDTISNGNYLDVEADPGAYDVRAEDCEGGYLEEYGLEIDADAEIEVYEDGINLYEYGE